MLKVIWWFFWWERWREAYQKKKILWHQKYWSQYHQSDFFFYALILQKPKSAVKTSKGQYLKNRSILHYDEDSQRKLKKIRQQNLFKITFLDEPLQSNLQTVVKGEETTVDSFNRGVYITISEDGLALFQQRDGQPYIEQLTALEEHHWGAFEEAKGDHGWYILICLARAIELMICFNFFLLVIFSF